MTKFNSIFRIFILVIGMVVVLVNVGESAETAKPEPIIELQSGTFDEREQFFYDSQGRPDPMAVPWFRKEDLQPVNVLTPPIIVEIDVAGKVENELNAIVYCQTDPANSLVMLGEAIVKVGDTISVGDLPKSIRIVRIGKDQITVSYEGRNYHIKIKGN